ncbi:MAG TPA: ABC transporter permease, partial [Terriglobales bacterium]|nr:ABC transporter permease [Terriglobales bacterium]
LFEDFRFAFRLLRKTPGFTVVAVLTLALGTGANTAIFSVIHAVLLRPLPFHNPRQLVAVNTTEPGRADDPNVSYPVFLDWRSQNHVFEGLSVFRVDDFTLTGRAEPLHVNGAVVSANTLSLLGVAPVLGRDFNAEEDQPVGTGLPIILSHSFWQDRFGSDPNVLGESLTLSGQLFTVAGVMPPGFQFPVQPTTVDFWTTMALDAQPINGSLPMTAQRGAAYLDVIARLKAEVTLAQAQTDMSRIQSALNKQYPENRPRGIAIVPELDQVVGEIRPGLLILFGAVGLVLLIACANLSNLLLARATARSREISVRKALGATRWVVVRQMLAESMLLAAVGGAAGLVFAVWAVNWFTRLAPGDLPRISESGLNLEVLIFTATVAVFTSLLFGLIPALDASGRELATSLNEGGRSGTETRGQSRLKDAFVITETALAVVLLAGAGLLLRSLQGLGRVDPGFRKDHVITFGLDLPGRYGHPQRIEFYRQLLGRVRSLPGVRSASAAFPLPLSADEVKTVFEIDGRPVKGSERPVTTLHVVDQDYFRVLGIPLLSGREFDSRDDAPDATAVVIISQNLAKRAFPGEDPIGKRIRPDIASGDKEAPPIRFVVGVAGDVKAEGLAAPSIPESYVPYAQLPFAPMSLVVRTAMDPQTIVPPLTREVQSLDKDLPLLHVKTLDEYVGDSIADTRFETVLLGSFGVLALVLTAVGLYGVISYTVVERTREMGIRLALGAERDAIVGMIVKNGTWLAGMGIGIGLAASFLVTRLIRGLLYGVSPIDLPTFVAVPIVLIAVAILASYIPARRAARVDPMVALHYE